MSSKKSTHMSTLIERFFILAKEFAEGKHTNLAKLADIPKSTFQGYINGRPPHIEHLLRIRERFDINLDWLLTGEGEMTQEQAQNARMHLGVITKEQSEANKRASLLYKDMLNDPEVGDLLTKTWEIIKSDTGYAASLAANIRSFHQAMMTENRLNGMETQLQDVGEMKNIVKDLVQECKEIKERLKKSDGNIRQEDKEEQRGEILKKRAM